MALEEGGEFRRQGHAPERQGHYRANAPARDRAAALDGGLGILEVRQNMHAALVEFLAEIGGPQASRGAVEELRPQFVLQPCHGLGYRPRRLTTPLPPPPHPPLLAPP